jgi:hypothetical protein
MSDHDARMAQILRAAADLVIALRSSGKATDDVLAQFVELVVREAVR